MHEPLRRPLPRFLNDNIAALLIGSQGSLTHGEKTYYSFGQDKLHQRASARCRTRSSYGAREGDPRGPPNTPTHTATLAYSQLLAAKGANPNTRAHDASSGLVGRAWAFADNCAWAFADSCAWAFADSCASRRRRGLPLLLQLHIDVRVDDGLGLGEVVLGTVLVPGVFQALAGLLLALRLHGRRGSTSTGQTASRQT